MTRGTLRREAPAALLAALAVLTLTAACSSPISPTPTPDAPTLTCPADITVQSLNASPVVVPYAVPQAAGGSAPVAVACSPTSGSVFAPGATSVNCTASDALQRTAACAFTVRVTVPPRLTRTRFMAFGDSLTEGKVSALGPLFKLGDFPGSYPTDLYTLMTARYLAQTVTMSKQGYGGEATATGVVRLQGLLATERPEVLLLLEGANDLYGGDPAAVAPAVNNVRTMVTMARGAGATVLLANLPPQRPGGYRAGGAGLVTSYNLALSQVGATTGATMVDLFTPLSADIAGYVGPDGLHLTQAGYQKIAETFFERIKATLETPGVLTSDMPPAPSLGRVVPESTRSQTPARPVERASEPHPRIRD